MEKKRILPVAFIIMATVTAATYLVGLEMESLLAGCIALIIMGLDLLTGQNLWRTP